MRRKVYHHSSWYCDVVDEAITWKIGHLVVDTLGGTRYAFCSASCSRYMTEGCKAYGIGNECKVIMEEAKKVAQRNLLV